MKKNIIIIFVILFSINLAAQTAKEVKVEAKIEKVILYLDGAEIMHNQNVRLAKGRNLVVFENITPRINASSIRVTTGNNVPILAVNQKLVYQKKNELLPEIKRVEDSLMQLRDEADLLKDEQLALTTERDMLLKNTSIGGQNNGVSIEQLKSAAEFYRSRIFEISKRLSAIKIASLKNNERKKQLTLRKTKLSTKINYQRSIVSVLLDTENGGNQNIQLRYLLATAGWSPTYDISVEEINKEVELIYRANVFNNTGIDWENMDVTLSTANPWQSATKPDMKPWYLNFGSLNFKKSYSSTNRQNSNQLDLQSNQGYTQNGFVLDDNLYQTTVGGVIPSGAYEEIDVTDLNAVFELSTNYSIPADNKPYIVDVTKHNLPAVFKHYSIPKVDRDAFLLAKITGWEDLNLVEGEANIYFGGTYVGKSYIQTRNVKDTLDISFGRDKKVLVTRTKLKKYSSTKLIGSKRKEILAYRMIIKNNRKQPIEIEMKDQIPVSQDSEIEVEKMDISNGIFIETTGEIRWKFRIESGQSKTIDLTFSVKYPKSKVVEIKQSQKRSVRKF